MSDLFIDAGGVEALIHECGDPGALAGAASDLARVGPTVVRRGDEVATSWTRLDGCYFAPETGALVAAIEPVRSQTTWVAQSLKGASGSIHTFAGQLGTIKSKLEELKSEAESFNAWAQAHPGWESSSAPYYQNHTLNRADQERGRTVAAGPSLEGIHQWHDRIVTEIREQHAALKKAEADCAAALLEQVGINPIGDVSGGGADSGDLPSVGAVPCTVAEPSGIPALSYKDAFGGLWIEHGPWADRFGTAVLKNFADGISGLASLFGASYDWNFVTGGGKWDFGLHVLRDSWGGLGKLVLATTGIGVVGGIVLAGAGHPTLLKKWTLPTYGNIWRGVSGAGLPGGWAVRSGYLTGSLIQAAIPGPGKLAEAGFVAKLGEWGAEEGRAASAARLFARGIEATKTGGWILGDVRLTSHWLGLDGKLADRLHNLTPVRALSNRVTAVTDRLRFGHTEFPELTDARSRDLAHHLGEKQVPLADDAAAAFSQARAAAQQRLDVIRDHPQAGVRDSTRGVVAHFEGSRELRDLARSFTNRYRDEVVNPLADHTDRLTTVTDGTTASFAPVYGPNPGVRGARVTAVTSVPLPKGLEAFEHALGTQDAEHLLDLTPNGDALDEHLNVNTVHTLAGVHQEITIAQKVRGRPVESVIGVVYDDKILKLPHPKPFYADRPGGPVDRWVPLPPAGRELYRSELREEAWEIVPGHNLREVGAQTHEGAVRHEEHEEAARERRELAERWERVTEDGERARESGPERPARVVPELTHRLDAEGRRGA